MTATLTRKDHGTEQSCCLRCGITLLVHAGRPPSLCGYCRYVLEPAERKAWTAA